MDYQDVVNDTMRFLRTLSLKQWMGVFAVVVGVGAMCMRGFGGKRRI